MAYTTLSGVKTALTQLASDNEFSVAGRQKILTLANQIVDGIPSTDLTAIANAVVAALPSTLVTKADLTPLAKSSELASLVTESDLTTALSGVAKASDLTSLAKSTELEPLAKTSDLASLVTKTYLDTKVSPLAKSSEIPADYAKSEELDELAHKSDLEDLAKSEELPRDYAKASKLQDLQSTVNNFKTEFGTFSTQQVNNNFTKSDAVELKGWLNTTRNNALDTAYAKAFVYVESRIAALYDALTTASTRLISEFAEHGEMVGQYSVLVDEIGPKVDALQQALTTLESSVVTANSLTTFVTDVLAISQLIDKMNLAWKSIAEQTTANRNQLTAIMSTLTSERSDVIKLVEDLVKYAKTTNVVDSSSNAVRALTDSLRLAKEYDEKKKKELEDSVF